MIGEGMILGPIPEIFAGKVMIDVWALLGVHYAALMTQAYYAISYARRCSSSKPIIAFDLIQTVHNETRRGFRRRSRRCSIPSHFPP